MPSESTGKCQIDTLCNYETGHKVVGEWMYEAKILNLVSSLK